MSCILIILGNGLIIVMYADHKPASLSGNALEGTTPHFGIDENAQPKYKFMKNRIHDHATVLLRRTDMISSHVLLRIVYIIDQ